MNQQTEPVKQEERKKIEAKPLPVVKEKTHDHSAHEHKHDHSSETESTKKSEDKKKKVEAPKIKKEEAIARGLSVSISKKHAIFVCRFVMHKTPDKAIADLHEVIKLRKPVPYKGEIPYRKGGIKGRYPVNAAKKFIKLLKGLKENAVVNGLELEKSKIYFASATWAARPARRGGMRGKRTNIILKVKEISPKQEKKE